MSLLAATEAVGMDDPGILIAVIAAITAVLSALISSFVAVHISRKSTRKDTEKIAIVYLNRKIEILEKHKMTFNDPTNRRADIGKSSEDWDAASATMIVVGPNVCTAKGVD